MSQHPFIASEGGLVIRSASTSSLLAFLAIVALATAGATWCVYQAYRGQPKQPRVALFTLGAYLVVFAASFLLARSGVFKSWSGTPKVMLPVVVTNAIALIAALSPFGKQLASELPTSWLVGIQMFRLPLELVLHSWWVQGVIPQQ